MKICCYGDCHWSQYSSILRKRNDVYSFRLDNEIQSINWIENLAKNTGCELIVELGDFFDKPELNSEEIAALQNVKWSDIPHKFIVGNHEMGSNSLLFNSAQLFTLNSNIEVIVNPIVEYCPNTELCFLPYTLEENRKDISSYFGQKSLKSRIIFSHNDIKGIQLGQFISTNGFDITDIQDNCNIFINGHLHNGGVVAKKIINCGNLTGQNFSEDAEIYSHGALILDTEDMSVSFYENPYAINFYKFESFDGLKMTKLKSNAVITVKVLPQEVSACKEFVSNSSCIVESRILVHSVQCKKEVSTDTFSIDHISRFRSFMIESLGSTDIVLSELEEIIK